MLLMLQMKQQCMPKLVIGVAAQAHVVAQVVAPPPRAVIPNVVVAHHIAMAVTGRQTKKIALQLISLRTNACD